jgi:hypothetical protein
MDIVIARNPASFISIMFIMMQSGRRSNLSIIHKRKIVTPRDDKQ